MGFIGDLIGLVPIPGSGLIGDVVDNAVDDDNDQLYYGATHTPHRAKKYVESETIEILQSMGISYPVTDCALLKYLAKRNLLGCGSKSVNQRTIEYCKDNVHSGHHLAWCDNGDAQTMLSYRERILQAIEDFRNSGSLIDYSDFTDDAVGNFVSQNTSTLFLLGLVGVAFLMLKK